MSTRHQKSFVTAAFVAILFSIQVSAGTEGRHNLILIIPEALPAVGIDQSNAPALARLRRDGVTFANSHSGFPRLIPAESFVDTSDLRAESLIAAATDDYYVSLVPDDHQGAGLQQLVSTTLPQAKQRTKPFFIVYQLKARKGLDNSQSEKAIRPAFKPDPRAVNAALDTIEESLRALGLFDDTNIIVAAEHGFSRVIKVSNTSRAKALLPREDTLGVLPPGFLAIDLVAALRIDNPRLELFDPDAGNSFVRWDNGGHPQQGNAVIAADYEPAEPYVTVQAHGVYDSIFLGEWMSKSERRAIARLILETIRAQDYLGGVFVNEKRLGLFRGALPLSHIAQHHETEGLPDIVVLFAPGRERCAPAEVCTSVIADTPLIEGEGIANAFSRSGTATFMAARGPDFQPGLIDRAPASNADIHRTIVELLDLQMDSTDTPNARVLREALTGAGKKAAPQAKRQTVMSAPALDGWVTELHVQTLGVSRYLDYAVSSYQEGLAAEIDPPRRQWRWPFKTFTITISDDTF